MGETGSPISGRDAAIRPACADDAAAVARVHAEAWQSAYRSILPASVLQDFRFERRLPFWREMLAAEQLPLVRVADIAGAGIAGFVWARPIVDARAAYDGEIVAIAVDPVWQRAGLGRLLMGAAAEALADGGSSTLYLWVYRDNQAAKLFYESLGGRIVDRDVEQFRGLSVPIVAYGWDALDRLIAAAGRKRETGR